MRGRLALLVTAIVALGATPVSAEDPGLVRQGRALYLEACAACHGQDARGVKQLGPSLAGVGALAADFYLETGRMPLAHPNAEPERARPAYSAGARRAVTAYIGSLGGPPIPDVEPGDGTYAEGKRLFTEHCSGCHQVVGKGGIVPPDGVAPPLDTANARQIKQAIRIGPYLMPHFSEDEISDPEIDSIARYVLETRHPVNRGGWGIGNLGPVPEGMVSWFIAGGALLLLIRVLGKRTP